MSFQHFDQLEQPQEVFNRARALLRRAKPIAAWVAAGAMVAMPAAVIFEFAMDLFCTAMVWAASACLAAIVAQLTLTRDVVVDAARWALIAAATAAAVDAVWAVLRAVLRALFWLVAGSAPGALASAVLVYAPAVLAGAALFVYMTQEDDDTLLKAFHAEQAALAAAAEPPICAHTAIDAAAEPLS
jgi:hypothetical protein